MAWLISTAKQQIPRLGSKFHGPWKTVIPIHYTFTVHRCWCDSESVTVIDLCCAQDYVDAFEKLLHLTSKQPQSQREAVHIVLKLCLGERTFNEFYAHLLDKLCGHHRQLQVCISPCFWWHPWVGGSFHFTAVLVVICPASTVYCLPRRVIANTFICC